MVADPAGAVVGPDQDHAAGNLEEPGRVEVDPLDPEIGDAIGLGLDLVDHGHLPGDGIADDAAAGGWGLGLGVVLPERPVVFAAQADGPDHLAVLHGVDAELPHVVEDLRMGAIGIGDFLGPLEGVQADHADVVLAVDQPTFLGQHLEPLVGEGESAGNHRVGAQPQQRFIDPVPHFQGEDAVVQGGRREAGQQILVVHEPAAILERRRSVVLVQVGGNENLPPRRRFLVDPVVPGIDAQQLFAHGVGGIDGPARIGARRHQGRSGQTLHETKGEALRAGRQLPLPGLQPGSVDTEQENGRGPPFRRLGDHARQPAKDLVPITLHVA